MTGAIVSITNTATGQIASVTTNSAGAYTFAFLKPGDYVVRIEAKGFKVTGLPIPVKVNQTANGDATLVVGDSSEMVDVLASDNVVPVLLNNVPLDSWSRPSSRETPRGRPADNE